ncbi:MAG: hypothetical protein WDW38_007908 [Sanguina aurantia]
MQAASCVDASSGFSGNLTFMHSTFADNGPAVGSLSTVNAPPVAVNCAGGSGPVSCSITVQDTLFESNRGREALGMGLTCLAPSTQTCNFDVTRSNFTQHQLVGTGSSYAMPYSITTVAAMYTSVGTTAAALVVKVDGASAFSLAVSLCHFAANDGAGLWVEQSRPDSHPTSVRGEVSITGSSFTGHAELPGGLPALAVFGARGVSLTDTLWEGNRMGAVALECIQDEVFVDAVVVRDNLAHSSTAATFDIYMMDAAPSNVTVTGSSFVNNTGFTSLPPGALYYSGAGSINVASHVSQGAVNISIAATSFLSNHGSLSPGALSIITADGVIMTGVLAAGNVGGAAFFYNVTTLLVSNSTFDANEGLTGPGSNYIAKSPGGGAVTSVSPIGVAGQSSQVSNCHFNNNSALTSGAALYFTGLSVINVQDCVFTSNRALTGFGGAINTNLMAAPSMVTLSNSRFHDNVAAIAGGAVLATDLIDVVRITNTTFTTNSAGILASSDGWALSDPYGFALQLSAYYTFGAFRGGGALFLTNVAQLSILDSQFYGCTAPHSLGGALRLRFSGASFLRNCTFVGNSALSGGALSLSNMKTANGEVCEITNTTFTGNSAYPTPQLKCPGAFCIPNDDVRVPGDGGAISASGGVLLLSGGCKFDSNSAQGRGGALCAALPFDNSYIQVLSQPGQRTGSEAIPGVLDNVFLHNSAQVSGGAIALRRYPLYISSAPADTSPGFRGIPPRLGPGGAVFWSHAGNLNITCNIQGRVQRAGVFTAAGLVDVNLPCADWDGNSVTAGYGPVIASTPFFLEPVEREVPFYTSNQPLLLNVTVQSTITVRPCQLNEYVDPGGKDLCVNCSSGTYNLVTNNTHCVACPPGATCSSACLGNTTCLQSDYEFAGFIVPTDGLWHSSMFSDQVMPCPKASSCSFPTRQQQLQQLQVTVRNAYHKQQYIQAVGQLPLSNAYHHHRALTQQLSSVEELPDTPSTKLAFWSPTSIARLVTRTTRALMDKTSSLPSPSGPNSPTRSSTPPPQPLPSPTPEESGDAALMDAFFASVALDMDAYSDAQCAEGYKGRLCGVCADGYGSTDIATCVKCPTFALNTLYYLLATLLTLALLALAMHTSIKEAAKMQMEHDERIQAAQELEEQDEELDQQGGSVINTMRNSGGKANQRPSERSSPVSAVGHLKMDTPTTNTMTSTGEPHAHHSQASLEGLQPRQGDQEPAALHPLSTTHTDESQPAVRGGEVQMPGAGAPFNTLVAVDNGVSPSERHGVVDSGSVVSQIKANKMLHGDATAAVDGERPVRSHFHDPRSPFLEDAQQAQAVVIRILLSYLQVLGLLQNVPHIYPSKVQRFLVISSQSTSPGAAVSLDCSLPAYETASKATIQTIVFALAPVYIVMACWIGWTLRAAALYHLARLSGKGRNGIDPTLPMLRGTSMYLARVLTMTCVVVVFFFYPASVQSLLEIFDCDVVDVGAPSNPLMARAGLSYGSYWRQEYSQQCYVGAHEALAMGLGVPGLALLALGWPFMCGLWLYMNTQKLYQDPHFTGM